jgi:putative heme-binding domain-containing protein
MHDVAAAGEASRIYPISKFWTTSQLHAGQFTAACGVMIYRGVGLGEEYYGNAFTCDPTGDLVHREVLAPSGATFTGHSPYEKREFLATPDSWCRPVNLAHGPDGALYVVDMYRAVIEHPDWVPVELKNRPDERYGDDRGRIYRVMSKKRSANRPTQHQRLDQTTTSDQAALLSHPNAWQRDTALRLLNQQWSDFTFRTLSDVIQGNATPQAKVAAIRLCQRFAPERDYGTMVARQDKSGRVREATLFSHDVLLSGPLTVDTDPRTRFGQALALADTRELPEPDREKLMVDLTAAGVSDPWMRTAILLNIRQNGPVILRDALQLGTKDVPIPGLAEFLEELATVIAVRGEARELADAFQAAFGDSDQNASARKEFVWAVIRGLALGQQRRGKSWGDLAASLPAPIKARLSAIAAEAAQLSANRESPVTERMSAMRLLKFHVDPAATATLLGVATGDLDSSVRLAALDSLLAYSSAEIGPRLLETFPAETPAVRRAILDVLLANEQRTELLLKSLEDKSLALSEIDPNRSARLTNHRNADIKQRAAKLFAAAAADRAAVLEKYASAARMDADARNGRIVFEKNCATCHRVSNIGVNVGPDVGDNYARKPEMLLLSILDPNRAVDNNYFGYTVTTLDGRVLTGIITAETASSITLKQPEGKIEVVLRSDIDELRGSGLSLMPVGLEKNITVDQMADLITFLKNWRYIDSGVPIETGSK